MPGTVGYIPEYPKRQRRGIADLFGGQALPGGSYDSPFPDSWRQAWEGSRGGAAGVVGKGEAPWLLLAAIAAAAVLLFHSGR